MKVIGAITLLVLGVCAALYFGGMATGEANVELTDKGRSTVNSGIEKTQRGLDHLKMQPQNNGQ